MLASLAADFVVVIHLAFVLFVVGGGLVVLRWPRAAWLHLPAAAWGAGIVLLGGVCPLTPLEKALRSAADRATYEGGFGDPLFVRAPGALTPTPLAARIAPLVERQLHELEEALAASGPFDPAKGAIEWRLSLSDLGEIVFLSAIVEMLRREAPRTRATLPDLVERAGLVAVVPEMFARIACAGGRW